MVKKKKSSTTIFTIGHSTHTTAAFIELLKHYAITHLVDIRTIPKSRHNPQFNEAELKTSLAHVHINYTHLQELGGLCHAHINSVNMGWHNASFRGFADYMQTEEFVQGIEKLIEMAQHKTIAIMCAEAVPWRCHRSLVGDALLVRGVILRRTSFRSPQ
jgi:uncharacterized protein (DUF488 family)